MTVLPGPASLVFAACARAILAEEGGANPSAEQSADAVAQACEKLAHHFSRIVGADGVRTILVRSVLVARAAHPWLGTGKVANGEEPWATLRVAMAAHPPEVTGEAFVTLLSTFVALLGRLIGDGLVTRLISELWPWFLHRT